MHIDAVIGGLTLCASVGTKLVGEPDQIRRNVKRRSTNGLSPTLYGLGLLSYVLWTVHGVLRGDWVIVLVQSIGILTSATIISQMWRYGRRSSTALRAHDDIATAIGVEGWPTKSGGRTAVVEPDMQIPYVSRHAAHLHPPYGPGLRSMSIVIQRETTSAMLEEVFRLRASVWRQVAGAAYPHSLESWADEHDDHAMHWTASCQGELVGAARMCVHQYLVDAPYSNILCSLNFDGTPSFACFCRLVVDRRFRGLGISGKLDSARLALARELHCGTVIVLVSELSRAGRQHALRSLGFTPVAPDVVVTDWTDRITTFALFLRGESNVFIEAGIESLRGTATDQIDG